MSKLLIVLLLSSNLIFGKDDRFELRAKLDKEFPGIKISERNVPSGYSFAWELQIQQWLDHHHHEKGTFYQTVYLYHKGFKNTNVLVTEGYQIEDRIYEPTMILDANQFSVEFRFCGGSQPESIDWKLLNHDQALNDLHWIKTKLAKIYKKNWLATGISKGGTTSALYSLSYPKDIKATVAYVAPFVLAQEDPRTIRHYRTEVSTPECRAAVKEFQRDILRNRKELIPMIEALAIRDQTSFPITAERVLEYAALEFPFSFWQWGFDCSKLPDHEPNSEEIYDLVEEIVDFNYYDLRSVKQFEPAFYQFMTEYGYYGFDTLGLSDLLIYEKNPSNLTFCPSGVEIKYNPSYMIKMTKLANEKGKNIIYIYGERDTWTSCAVNPSSKTNCKKFIKENAGHRVKIRNFSPEIKQEIYTILGRWTKTKPKPLPY